MCENSKSERSERALRLALVSLRTWAKTLEAKDLGVAGLGSSCEALMGQRF